MAKRIRLSSVSTDSWETDWTKCCLCQEDTVETLKLTADGYKMLAINIPKFHEINSLPIPLDVKRFNNGSGIESTLTTNEAKYHPSCRIKFNNTKLKRVEQRYESTKSIKTRYNKERAVKKRTEEQAQIDTDAEKEAGDVALAELVNYVFETQRNSDGANAFRLADLSNMYEKRVQQLSEGTIPIHRTRLKEMLLAKIPDLQAYTKGREVLLVFEKDVGPAIALACNYDDTIHIGKTAEIIRAQIKEHKTNFSDSFSAEDTK
ncbi:Hypothetical predicted protein [Mytilus galloprovincialis]|uniref:Uncharacterized protein n=1 Tax=Mytilus galloprovincialis TaxID=29158 RepID=A0A8B6FDK6_MYTGA|nr:Hypothetical predicted protein [Mytilus galloprovincialis]